MGSHIQDAIWSFEEGQIGSVLRFFGVVILAAVLLGTFAWFRFTGIVDPQALEQCSLARNLADGKGFSATCIRPAEIATLQHKGRTVDLAHFPEIRQEPAYPVALSGAMRLIAPRYESRPRSGIFIPEAALVIPFGLLCTLAAAGLVYLVTRSLFSAESAPIATIAFLIWDPVLTHGISGGSLPLLSLTTTLSLWLAIVAARACNKQRNPTLWLSLFAASGILAGITCLGAYVLWPLIPGAAFLGACLCERRRGTIFLLLLTAGIITIAPWLYRNIALTGNPFGSAPSTLLDGTSLFPVGAWDASTAALPTRAEMVDAIKTKFFTNIPLRIESLFQLLGSTVLAAFFMLAFFIRFDDESANRSRWPILVIIAAVVISSSLGNSRSATYVHAFLPLVATFGTAAVLAISEHRDYLLPETRSLIAWSVVGLNALPLLLNVWGTAPQAPYPPYFPPLNAYAARQLAPSAILCTDIPWATAWYANRISILTPATPLALETLRTTFPSIQGLYLTARRQPSPDASQTNNWTCLQNEWAPPGFTMTNGLYLPPGTRDQLLLLNEDSPAATP